MIIRFTSRGWRDYCWWVDENPRIARKLNELIEQASRDPAAGLGKPEPLKYEFQGAWSRRISDEHRLIYLHEKGELTVLACRYHYEK